MRSSNQNLQRKLLLYKTFANTWPQDRSSQTSPHSGPSDTPGSLACVALGSQTFRSHTEHTVQPDMAPSLSPCVTLQDLVLLQTDVLHTVLTLHLNPNFHCLGNIALCFLLIWAQSLRLYPTTIQEHEVHWLPLDPDAPSIPRFPAMLIYFWHTHSTHIRVCNHMGFFYLLCTIFPTDIVPCLMPLWFPLPLGTL